MSDKMKNLIVRTITGVLFVAAIVTCFLRPEAMILLFALVTGLTIWEFTGIVNDIEGVTTNRLITTVAGVYFFFSIAGYCSGIVPSAVFIPYLLTIVYLFIAELYTKAPNPINNWAYTMLAQMYIALPFSTINVLAFRATGDGVVYNYLLPLSVLSSFGLMTRVLTSADRSSASTSSFRVSAQVRAGREVSVADSSCWLWQQP